MSILISAVFSVGLTAYLFSQNLKARFWVIDDHSIFNFLNQWDAGKSFWALMMSSELGSFGSSNRFRPAYYTLYPLESILYRDNSFLWYSTNLVMCVIFLFCLTEVLKKHIGLVGAILCAAMVMAFPYWSDIWSRIGTGEMYCAPGLGLFLLGYQKALESKDKKTFWAYGLILLGTLIAGGAKENFVLLLVPLVILFIYQYRKKYLHALSIATISLSSAYLLFIAFEIVLAISKSKSDFYANPVTLEQRLSLILKYFSHTSFVLIALGCFASLVFWIYANRKNQSFIPLARKWFFILFAASAILGSQFIFYNANWPTGMRYDFPGVLVLPILIALMCFEVAVWAHKRWPRAHQMAVFAVLYLVIANAYFRPLKAYRSLKDGVYANIERTHGTMNVIDKVRELSALNPELDIVIESYDPINYESIVSLRTFFTYYKLMNQNYLRIHDYSSANQSNELYRILATMNENTEKQKPFKFDKARDCISIHIGVPKETDCKHDLQL